LAEWYHQLTRNFDAVSLGYYSHFRFELTNDRNDEKIRVLYSNKIIVAPKSTLFQKFIRIIEKENDYVEALSNS